MSKKFNSLNIFLWVDVFLLFLLLHHSYVFSKDSWKIYVEDKSQLDRRKFLLFHKEIRNRQSPQKFRAFGRTIRDRTSHHRRIFGNNSGWKLFSNMTRSAHYLLKDQITEAYAEIFRQNFQCAKTSAGYKMTGSTFVRHQVILVRLLLLLLRQLERFSYYVNNIK